MHRERENALIFYYEKEQHVPTTQLQIENISRALDAFK